MLVYQRVPYDDWIVCKMKSQEASTHLINHTFLDQASKLCSRSSDSLYHLVISHSNGKSPFLIGKPVNLYKWAIYTMAMLVIITRGYIPMISPCCFLPIDMPTSPRSRGSRRALEWLEPRQWKTQVVHIPLELLCRKMWSGQVSLPILHISAYQILDPFYILLAY